MSASSPPPLDFTRILTAWWPLALSWLLMGVELPMISSVVARLPDQQVQLAAFGGVVFPLALLVEAPVIMMLAASTALSTNDEAFRVLKRFMGRTAFVMTVFHVLFAFTPLYDIVLVPLLDIPDAVIEPARLGFMIMLPWTWAIADRRFHQGLLIRFGHRNEVAIGTGVRLCATILVLVAGALLEFQGAVVAGAALSISTLSEAIYARVKSRKVITGALIEAPVNDVVVRGRKLLSFYIPLAMTPFLVLAMLPIGAAGIDRMANPIESLAVWAPLNGLVFLCRSAGVGFNEVVIGHYSEPGARASLRRFAWIVGGGFSILLAVISIPPMARFWFGEIIGLESELIELGTMILWLTVPIPLLTFLQSFYQGAIVDAHRTRYITESVIAFFIVTTSIIVLGVFTQPEHGITAVVIATTIGNLVQTLWLWLRCKTKLGV